MNIFVLDSDVNKCVEYHVDRHVVKMILEYSQLLCSAHHMTDTVLNVPYRLTHKNHPCSVWTRQCIENYNWLCQLAWALCSEYTYRYKKIHKTQAVIKWAFENPPNLPSIGHITKFALAMPDECKFDDPIESYRYYYINFKNHIASWKFRNKPYWYEK